MEVHARRWWGGDARITALAAIFITKRQKFIENHYIWHFIVLTGYA